MGGQKMKTKKTQQEHIVVAVRMKKVTLAGIEQKMREQAVEEGRKICISDIVREGLARAGYDMSAEYV